MGEQKTFIFGKDAIDLCAIRHYTDNPTEPITCRIENQPIFIIESWENVSTVNQTALINALSAKGWTAIN